MAGPNRDPNISLSVFAGFPPNFKNFRVGFGLSGDLELTLAGHNISFLQSHLVQGQLRVEGLRFGGVLGSGL